MENELRAVIFISKTLCEKCSCFNDQATSVESIESVAAKEAEELDNVDIIYQTDCIKLDEVAVLANIKNKIPSLRVTVCTNEANKKYSELIKGLDFRFELKGMSKCANCKFNYEVYKIISSWLLFNCSSRASYYTHRMINLISYDIANASLHELSKKLSISEEYLSRIIKRDCDKNFRTIINELKLYIVQEITKQYNLSDQDMAEFLGYNELTNFYRFIKKMKGKPFSRIRAALNSPAFLSEVNGAA